MPKKTKSVKISDIKGNKPWLKQVENYKYAIETSEKNKQFLIVCEGQTEELYFKSFPVLAAEVKCVHQGCSKSALVECVSAYLEGEEYDEIWCVFDMDFKPGHNGQFEDFNNAIRIAEKEGYKSAYSNDAFELWFVLHYQFLEQKHLRHFFYQTLSKRWNINYEKSGKSRAFVQSIYKKLMDDSFASQDAAISHAHKLHILQKEQKHHLQNPVTLVYLLVKELNVHLRR